MIVVAGHLCLDVIPAMRSAAALQPGVLAEVGPVAFAGGGAVANVGMTLIRLGLEPRLLGRIGNDPFGQILRRQLLGPGPTAAHSHLLEGVTSVPTEGTSYSVVISPPGRDRTFLHHSGCNDSFTPADLDVDRWLGADLLHFGYPPLMRGIYQDGGRELAAAFGRLRRGGVTVSLDMAMPDAEGPAGEVGWLAFLETVLPEVDLFLPSWDEICFMLEPRAPRRAPTAERLAAVADRLLALGPAVVGLKLGEDGLYLFTADAARLAAAGRSRPPADWADRELLSPIYVVDERGTTGAGDATIAGLLAALSRGVLIEQAASIAVAVGASSVEGVDATGGVTSWDETLERMARGWQRSGSKLASGWSRHDATRSFLGPNDRGGRV